MYKLLIVDDEILIRNGIQNLIEWEIYGIEIIGEAEDGMKAYLSIKEEKPDLVLVDISMPNMNGLELIELCNHLEFHPKFIILSGYNNFQYVQKAIQLGALNYLLKPIDQDELTNTIISAVQTLDDLYIHHKQFQESIHALHDDILLRVVHNKIDSKELREKCQVIGISLHCMHMRIGIIKFVESENLRSLHPAIRSCQEICSSFCTNYIISDRNDNIIIFFKDSANNFTENDYIQTLSKCSDRLNCETKQQTIFALGNEANHSSQLSQSYNDATSKIEKKLILGDSVEHQLSKTVFLPSVKYSDFLSYMADSNKEKISSTIHDYFSELLAVDTTSGTELLKYHLIELVSYVFHSNYMNSYLNSELIQKKQTAFSIINQTDSVLQLEKNITTFFLSLAEHEVDTKSDANYSFLVQNTLDYISKNYDDCNLSLKTLAAQLDVNPAYLGREFAHATGEYFNDYLNRIRITKAISLLTSTTLKGAKIANSVGFINVSYFFTIFKKFTGQSPGDYRNTHNS